MAFYMAFYMALGRGGKRLLALCILLARVAERMLAFLTSLHEEKCNRPQIYSVTLTPSGKKGMCLLSSRCANIRRKQDEKCALGNNTFQRATRKIKRMTSGVGAKYITDERLNLEVSYLKIKYLCQGS